MTSLRGLLLAILLLPAVAALDVDDIPNPRPGGWTVDLTGTLRSETVRALDALGDAVQSSRRGQLAVVVVGSTDGERHREFATRLFNRWGIGQAGSDDGVLLFVALRDRRTEIVLGRGVEAVGAVRAVQDVVDGEMIPRFKRGEIDAAILAGARASALRILHVDPQAGEAPSTSAGADRVLPTPAGVIDLAPAHLDAPTSSVPALSPAERFTPPAARWSGVAALTTPEINPVVLLIAGVLTVAALAIGLRLWLRHRRRTCPDCRQAMVRLDERADDQHLSIAQQAEERLGSVDYDVWQCAGCAQVLTLRYGAWFSSWRACDGCGARTCRRTVTTLRSASYDFGGLERVDERCSHCSFATSHTRTTPRRQRPAASSGFNSSGSSFGSSARSSGSSGSSGSGFGGGRSSGSGGGGGW